MPFNFRDKPKLADRFRGKTGEEILNELQSDRRMFFDSPSWRHRHDNPSGFSRGFPFSDDRKLTNIRSYLDEIAARHPEFADQLKEPPWDEDLNSSLGRSVRIPPNTDQRNLPTECEAGTSIRSQQPVAEPKANLTNFGLRNTVPLGPGVVYEGERQQRSMSAPPDNRALDKNKRFVTKCEIPLMHDPTQASDSPQPNATGKGPYENMQQKVNNPPNVRVIPIQVEGREVPLVNTNINTSTNFDPELNRDAAFDARLPRDFGSYQRHSPRFAHKEVPQAPPQHSYAPRYQQYIPTQQHFAPTKQSMPHPQHPSEQQQQNPFVDQQRPAGPSNQPPPSKPMESNDIHSKPPPPPPPPQQKSDPKDPIEKVQVIQKEIEELMKQVEAFDGKSRSDKQYLMLDELLTRQLLLLDNIDTEGKENVRQARKETIRSIQRCISTLENKVPLLENSDAAGVSERTEEAKAENSSVAPQAMEVDKTKENTPVDVTSKESQSMDVDEKNVKDITQQSETENKASV